MHLYPIEGAARRVPKEATAWNTRDATWSMVIAGIDADPKQADALKAWGRAFWTAIQPFNLEGAYVNFMMDDEVQGRVQATYGENYQRLASVKAKRRNFSVDEWRLYFPGEPYRKTFLDLPGLD